MRQRSRRQGRAYAAIPNAAMRDERVSIEARGLLALLMTYADDWTFVVEHLQAITGVGRDKLRGMLKELEAAGYVVREVLRGDGGHLAGTEWVIVDDPEAAACGKEADPHPQDVGEQDEIDADSRPPENPSIGEDHRPPENQSIGRPPEKPTAGFSVPIRKTKDKKKPPTPLAGAGQGGVGDFSDDVRDAPAEAEQDAASSFDRFWAVYPGPVEREAARKAFNAVLASGEVEAESLIAAAVAYAGTRQVERGYPMKPANWLARGAWRELAKAGTAGKAMPASAAYLDAVALGWIKPVKEGRSYAVSSLKPAIARHMLAKSMVSADELRRVGIILR
ncbi:hypothetical protein [Paracoccus aestuariivivens]|uniref:Helix-turn-helix domain-containing protein n=1 Tax=Paracoccus aestuariivivens TaxID=1820333 RepID=A0A6L6JBP2_9RHOB|nr:hypothetical protein [Paracoccus aestuariivivens]MTH79400.1 hypothetical protein [Paracoccus aestuariivivens]